MLKISSDYHLGCNRTAHTTPASRERLKFTLLEQAMGIVNHQGMAQICLGDLYDTFWTDAKSLMHGVNVHSELDICLVGNHDVSGRTNTSSAVQFIKELDGRIWDEGSKASIRHDYLEGVEVQWINHKMTQTLFDESLEMVEAVGGVLLLHCNYNNGLAKDESSLNLTEEQAEKLLTKVDKIFIGHVHQSETHFDGRLILVGNIHPTSFSDISDKFVWYVDEGLNVTKDCVWSMRQKHLKFDYKSLFEDIYLDGYQFIEITGQAETSDLPKIARAISNLWKTLPNVLMIKNSVTSTRVIEAPKEVSKVDIITKVTNELQETELNDLWRYYLGRLDETN
jgi:DNA repair exonuclease SbcCD nuclease subunit